MCSHAVRAAPRGLTETARLPTEAPGPAREAARRRGLKAAAPTFDRSLDAL